MGTWLQSTNLAYCSIPHRAQKEKKNDLDYNFSMMQMLDIHVIQHFWFRKPNSE